MLNSERVLLSEIYQRSERVQFSSFFVASSPLKILFHMAHFLLFNIYPLFVSHFFIQHTDIILILFCNPHTHNKRWTLLQEVNGIQKFQKK